MTRNSKFIEPLAIAVAGGSSIRAAAAACKCAESTAYHLSCDPSFRLRVHSLRSEATFAAVGQLSVAASRAVSTLCELLDVTNEPSVRLNASKAILVALGPLTDQFEIRQRLDAVERAAQLRIHHGA